LKVAGDDVIDTEEVEPSLGFRVEGLGLKVAGDDVIDTEEVETLNLNPQLGCVLCVRRPGLRRDQRYTVVRLSRL
jgi:hypothetical protein